MLICLLWVEHVVFLQKTLQCDIVHTIDGVITFLSLIAHTPLIVICLHILLELNMSMQQCFRYIQQMCKWGADVIAKMKINHSKYIYCAIIQRYFCVVWIVFTIVYFFFIHFYQPSKHKYEHDIFSKELGFFFLLAIFLFYQRMSEWHDVHIYYLK